MKQVEVKRRQVEMLACLLGLINIIVFGSYLGDNGIAYLGIAYVSVSLVRILLSGSLATVLGKMLRARNAKGQYKNVLCIRKRVFLVQGSLALVVALLVAIAAGSIGKVWFQVPYSTFIVLLLAPTLVLRALSAVLVGGFQGEGSELPATVVAPLRQILLLGFGLLFMNLLGAYGGKVSALLGNNAYTAMYGGVGIAIAMSLTEVLLLLFLGLLMLGSRRHGQFGENEGMRQTDSLFATLKVFYSAMWIPALLQLLEILPLWLGALFYRKSVAESAVFAECLGQLCGKALVVIGVFVVLICTFLLPKNNQISIAYRKEDYRSAKGMFQTSLHIVMLCGVFCTVFVAVMAEPLAGLWGGMDEKLLGEMLRFGSILILLGVIYYYASELIKALGRKYHLLAVLCLMNLIFVILTTVFLNIGTIGILALIYAAMVSLALGCVILNVFCCRILHTGVDWLQVFAIPAGCGCVAGLMGMLLGKLLLPHLGDLVTVIVCLAVMMVIYGGILRFLKEKNIFIV